MSKKLRCVGICAVLTVLISSVSMFFHGKPFSAALHELVYSASMDNRVIPIKVTDTVLQSIENEWGKISDIAAARAYLDEIFIKIRNMENALLSEATFIHLFIGQEKQENIFPAG